jgi:hypothetical protein
VSISLRGRAASMAPEFFPRMLSSITIQSPLHPRPRLAAQHGQTRGRAEGFAPALQAVWARWATTEAWPPLRISAVFIAPTTSPAYSSSTLPKFLKAAL